MGRGRRALRFRREPVGPFESKADCLYAKPAYMKKFGEMVGGIAGQQDRVLVRADDEQLPVTFSWLPLSEIRGLHLDVGLDPPTDPLPSPVWLDTRAMLKDPTRREGVRMTG